MKKNVTKKHAGNQREYEKRTTVCIITTSDATKTMTNRICFFFFSFLRPNFLFPLKQLVLSHVVLYLCLLTVNKRTQLKLVLISKLHLSDPSVDNKKIEENVNLLIINNSLFSSFEWLYIQDALQIRITKI
jgi:hypothetical protein